ncbi:MAG: DoxX family protein [Bacteroidetes bacterium]|nr:MAG: DoxX family protein [Bacteroidota bacterium]
MTLGTLTLYIAIAALILTFAMYRGLKRVQHPGVSFLQNFCGALFVFSGWVKAVDPLGTAYKMEQYFAEFESTFSETWISFVAPVFPWLSEHAVLFSVVMIVFEIVLGLMLLLGAHRKFTAWAFLLLVAFFTFLTGFTYLTGYVPAGVNFFEFGKWGPYVETNMKVTDCGCFGDFLKLKPKVSFLKDVVLLVPALLFVFRHERMHQLFTSRIRNATLGIATLGLVLYCMSNYVWDIPHADFRPFKVGVNIAERKALEEEAEANVEITHYKIRDKESGKVIVLPVEQYLQEFKNYPKEKYDLEQVKTEPAVPRTKISDFEISDQDGNDVTEDILAYPGYSFMLIAYKIPATTSEDAITVRDTVFAYDTLHLAGTDSFTVERRVASVTDRQVTQTTYHFDPAYVERYTKVVNPVMEEAERTGVRVFAITAYADPAKLDDFRHETQSAYPFYVADDILLKTIVRSNPGIVLLHNGTIVQKWHWRQLPSFEEIRAKYGLGATAGQ